MTVRGQWQSLQDRLLVLLGSAADRRTPIVASMLRRDAAETTSYWLQLGVSVGIATLGLVVGSNAVIIGAMLVAPLMGPIVGLAMGLAAGSPFLVLRSSWRILLSVAVAVGGAAAMMQVVPVHEATTEIAARTSPTVLDLATAAFCALAGVYAAVRPGTDTATTAAGTSIGISLVPPLCASGFGVGTHAWDVAFGAALLFLTNMVAIVVVGTVAFVLVGFERAEIAAVERDELARGTPFAGAVVARLGRLFQSRWGPLFRFLMPFVLLAIVYVPLARALQEVLWEARTRSAVNEAIAHEPKDVIQSHLRIERHGVDVALVIVGTNEDAESARRRVTESVTRAANVTPRVEVLAIPDATALALVRSALITPPVVAPVEAPSLDLDPPLRAAHAAVVEAWPSTSAGEVLAVEVGTDVAGPLRIRVTHLGPELGSDALEMLRAALRERLERDVVVVDIAVPEHPLTLALGEEGLVVAVADALRATRGLDGIRVCVDRPKQPKSSPAERTLEGLLKSEPRVVLAGEGPWSIRFVRGPCRAAIDGGLDASEAGH